MLLNKNKELRSGWFLLISFVLIYGVTLLTVSLVDLAVTIMLENKGHINLSTNTLSSVGQTVLTYEYFFVLILQSVIVFTLCIVAWRYFRKRRIASMGIVSLRKSKKDLFYGLVLGTVLPIMILVIVQLVEHNEMIISFDRAFVLIPWFFAEMFFSSISEIVLVCFMTSIMRQTKNKYIIILSISVLFSILNQFMNECELISTLNIFLLYTLCVYMYYKCGNLWMPFGMYFSWYFVQGLLGFTAKSTRYISIVNIRFQSDSLLHGDELGPENGLLVTALLILAIICTSLCYRKRDYNFLEDEGRIEGKNIKKNDEFGGILVPAKKENSSK